MTSETPAVRASDQEREQTVEILRRHSVDGRLTLEEFAGRMERAYGAKTRDELDELTATSPRRRPRPRPQSRGRRRRSRAGSCP